MKLEFDGWDVNYLEANVPRKDLFGFLDKLILDILAISITMTFNINSMREIISRLETMENIKISRLWLVGEKLCTLEKY